MFRATQNNLDGLSKIGEACVQRW